VGCDGWGSRLTIYIANSPIIIDHHRSPTLREAIDFSIASHFQMASTVDNSVMDPGVLEGSTKCKCYKDCREWELAMDWVSGNGRNRNCAFVKDENWISHKCTQSTLC